MMERWKLGTRLRGLSGLSRRSTSTDTALVTEFKEGGNEVSAKNHGILDSKWGEHHARTRVL